MSNIQTVDHPNSEADNIPAAIQEDTAQQLLKFAKGKYSKKEEEVLVGTEFVVYCRMWVKAWIKFVDKKIVEKKLYKVDSAKSGLHVKNSTTPKNEHGVRSVE
jgi:hypothetical protein